MIVLYQRVSGGVTGKFTSQHLEGTVTGGQRVSPAASV